MENTVSIKLNKEFKGLYYKGGSAVSDVLVLYYKKKNQDSNRLGLTVSKKVGKAVMRNRIRRLIRENYRLREGKIAKGYDLVFVARKSAAEADFYKIGSAIDFLFKKSGLYR